MIKHNTIRYNADEWEYQAQIKDIEKTEKSMRKENKELDKDLKEAEEELKRALKKAEKKALKQVQKEIDKLLDSTGVKVKTNPAFIRRTLSNIVKHVKEIYFISDTNIEEKINQQEITYEDCRRELRQCVLFNYWSLKKFKSYIELDRIYHIQARKLMEEDRNLTGSERTIENLTRQVEKAQKLMGKSENNKA